MAPNKWITHVKEYAAKNGLTYRDAMKDAKCKAAYGPTTTPARKKRVDKRFTELPHSRVANEITGQGMEGEGIKQDVTKLGRKINRTFAKPAKRAFRDVGRVVLPMLKEMGNEALDVVTKVAPEMAGSALSALAMAAGQPELVPLAQALGEDLGGKAARGGRKIAKRKIRKSNPFGDKPLSEKEQKASNFVNQLGLNIAEAKGYNTTGYDNIGKMTGNTLANKYLNPPKRRVEVDAVGDAPVYQTEDGSLENADGTPYIGGQGLYAGRGMTNRTVQGRGAQLERHHSLVSKPMQTNFQWNSTIHPALLGRGLYA